MSRYIRLVAILSAVTLSLTATAQVSIQSPLHTPIEVTPPTSSGLDRVYVVESISGLTITFNAEASSRPTWLRYDYRGGGFAEEATGVTYSGSTSTLNNPEANCGYIIEDGSRRHYFWLTDYSAYRLELQSLTVSDESDCSSVILDVQGKAEPIRYYSINGMGMELSRDMTLSYLTLTYDDETASFVQSEVEKEISSSTGHIYADAPLCSTTFTLTGDRFLRQWGQEQSVESENYAAKAVATRTEAVQTERDGNDNEQHSDMSTGFGGSAPCEIHFSAAVTDAVVFKEWQIATDSEFYLITYRDNSTEMTHTFRDEGTCYVRFMVANAAGDCEAYGDTYEVSIGASDIKCPNAFSPGTSEGVNDEWKVSYKSIIDFECHIFNRWGVKITSLTNPSQGWDGKYKGKLVGPGVYYYVIKATGADGKQYNLSGDINIIGRNPNASTNGTPTAQ